MIPKEDFESLKYGDVVLATSRDCTDTSMPHVCIIITDGTVQHLSEKESKCVKYALCLSTKDSPQGVYEFDTEELHPEIKKYYQSIGSTSTKSKIRYNEPITLLRNGIKKIFPCTMAEMLTENNLICDLLCSDKYIYQNLVKKGNNYKNQFVKIGELCPCYNFGYANANEVKLCPECHLFVNCDFPDDKLTNQWQSEINCWIGQLKALGYEENEAYFQMDNPNVMEIIVKLEESKCQLMSIMKDH